MPANPAVLQLTEVIANLRREKQSHVEAIAEIDAAFAALNVPAAEGSADGPGAARRKTGRPAKSPKAKQPASAPAADGNRTRRRFAQTGDQFVLSLLDTPKSTAEIKQAWKKSGRGGLPGNALTRLVGDGNVRREAVAGVAGSMYSRA